MENKIVVRPLGRLAKIGDILMIPLMYLISGTFKEVPQRGHGWNNMKLSKEDVKNLNRLIMVHCSSADDEVTVSRWLFLFHMPIFGGWRNYVVLEPEKQNSDWYVGYICNDDIIGMSRIKIARKVRMLIGFGASFFGIDADNFEQIPIKKIGMGRIGDGGEFAKEKLF